MKNKTLMVLLCLIVSLVMVGCGKDKKEDKKDTDNVQKLTCVAQDGDNSVEMIIEQDTKTYKLTKSTMVMKTNISAYKEAFDENDIKELEKALCDDDTMEAKSCIAKINGDMATIEVELELEEMEKDIKEELNVKEFDADTLTKVKEMTEKNNLYSCKIS